MALVTTWWPAGCSTKHQGGKYTITSAILHICQRNCQDTSSRELCLLSVGSIRSVVRSRPRRTWRHHAGHTSRGKDTSAGTIALSRFQCWNYCIIAVRNQYKQAKAHVNVAKATRCHLFSTLLLLNLFCFVYHGIFCLCTQQYSPKHVKAHILVFCKLESY